MAKITFTDEILNQPLPEPKYKYNSAEQSEDEDEAPSSSSFKQSEDAYNSLQKEENSFNKKQNKMIKKNKHLLQLRNKQQKEQSKQQKEIKNNGKDVTVDKLKAFEQQLIALQQKSDRNRKLAVNAEEEEELSELDMDFLESIAEDVKVKSDSKVKPKKTVFNDEDTGARSSAQPKYDSKRDDYSQHEKDKNTNKVSKLKQLREAKNKTQRLKTNGVLIEKLASSSTNKSRQTVKNTKLAKLRSKLLK